MRVATLGARLAREGDEALPQTGKRGRPGGPPGRGIHALVTSLASAGLVSVGQPIAGRRAAFKTVRVAHVTVQGLDAMQDAMGQIARMTNPAALRPETRSEARPEPEAERRKTPETVP